jgi:DNA-directed RNA polymerase subunit L
MAMTRPKKQPYIKVKYKVDHPIAGIKKGDVVPIAFKCWANVPANIKAITELEEGPETLKDLKEAELNSLQELHQKLGEELEGYAEEEEPKKKKKK